MSTPTYTLINQITLAASSASVTFSSIPATYRDLVFVQSSLLTGGSSYSSIRFNSDSTGHYSLVTMRGTGSSAVSNLASSNSEVAGFPFFFESTTERLAATYQIFDYAQTNKHKTVLTRGNIASVGVSASAQRWPVTDAITSLTVRSVGSSFASDSTFSLYGIVG